MARPTWSGALTFAGFPVPVRVYKTIASRSGEGFKMLGPNGEPVRRVYVDSDGAEIPQADCLKGIETSKGVYQALAPEAVESITEAERTGTLEPERFPLAETVPIHLSKGPAMRVVPDPKVDGSERSFKTLWNGMYASGRAYVTKWVPRSGARDEIVVFIATEFGMDAYSLPFKSELADDLPEWAPEEDAAAAAMFEQVLANEDTTAFAHDALKSDYAQRRKAAVDAALAGKVYVAPEAAQAQAAVPDLMAAMQASLSGAPAKKAAPKKKAPAKAKPKAKA
jgi:non-homologous end joining protein Ku